MAAGPGRPARTRTRRATVPGPASPAGRPANRRRIPARPVRAFIPVASGALWAVVLLAALAVSSLLTVVVLTPVAALATATGIRSVEAQRRRRSRPGRPTLLLVTAVVLSVLDPLFALGGQLIGVTVLVLSGVGLAALVVMSSYAASARPLRSVAVRFVAAYAPVLAVTSVTLARHQGSNLALAMVGATLAYDMGAFLMGNGRTALGGPVAVVSGMLSVGVVGVFVAAVMNPPFSGARPVLAFAGVAVLAPLGVRLCQWPAGADRLPALRRLDSLALVAPAWVVMSGLLLHR